MLPFYPKSPYRETEERPAETHGRDARATTRVWNCFGLARLSAFWFIYDTVQTGQHIGVLGRAAKAAVGVVLALMILVASFLSVCPSLHHRLHDDSVPGHHASCVVCALASGQAKTSSAMVLVVLLLFPVLWRASFRETVPVESRFSSPFQERAPPLFKFFRSV
jgi:hypothetical protein